MNLNMSKKLRRQGCCVSLSVFLGNSMIITLIKHCLCRWSDQILSSRLVSGPIIRFANLRELSVSNRTVNQLPAYDSRYALLGLESLEDRRTTTGALFNFHNRCDFAHLSGLLQFESNSYVRKRNVGRMPFYYRTNFGRFEPLNSALMNFYKYCDLFGFRNDENLNVFRERLQSALLEERLGQYRS
jgi:hypothetical protein